MNPPAEHQLAEYVVVQRAGQKKPGKLPFQGGDKLQARARNSRGTKRKLVNYRFKGEMSSGTKFEGVLRGGK